MEDFSRKVNSMAQAVFILIILFFAYLALSGAGG